VKPLFQKLTTEPEEGFAFKENRADSFDSPWHAHPEFELVLVVEAKGYRVIGDNLASLEAGDLVFIGPKLPHIWQTEPSPKGRAPAHWFLIQFEEQCLGEGLLKLPAFEPVRQLFRRAMRGLHVVGQTRKQVSAMMRAMPRLNGLDRVVQFLRILIALAKSKECHPIASPDFASESNPLHLERMDRVFHFLHGHLQEDLRLVDAARTVNLSEGAFSHFFRSHTGKTFPHLLNELRIGRACRLLTETDKSISEVAYGCGFESLTNFNRQFRKIKGVRPREFREQMQRCLLDTRRGPTSCPADGRRIAGPTGGVWAGANTSGKCQ